MKRLISAILCCILSSGFACAQSLSENAQAKLTNSVRLRYARTKMEGTSIHKVSGEHILVVLVSAKKSPNMQRVAQVKASRIAGEYLKGATNKSITVYETIEKDQYKMDDLAIGTDNTHNTEVNSNMTQNTVDETFRQSEEHFSDRIIQTSLTRVGHMEPLTRFVVENGYEMFAYYMIVK